MKIKVGKKYVTRNGGIVTIIEYDNNYEFDGVKYPYRGIKNLTYFTYTKDGDFFVGDEKEFDENDIVKEYE